MRHTSRIQREYEPVQPTYAQSTTRICRPSLDDMGPGTDHPVPSRVRKPTLDEMSSHASRPLPRRDSPGGSDKLRADPPPPGGEGIGVGGTPARDVSIDSRSKAGTYGENIRGPHKPTLDEMGPHAERGLPVTGKPRPTRPHSPPPPGGVGIGVGGTPKGAVSGKPKRTADILGGETKKKHRHGRPRKTGRPGA